MNFKKLAITGASAALLLSSAIPAFADDPALWINNSGADVTNTITVGANSGLNFLGNQGDGNILTGNVSAYSNVLNQVNFNHLGVNVVSENGVSIDNSDASVLNTVDVWANTGGNGLGLEGDGNITTGTAGAASYVTNVVNTNLIGF